MTLRIATVSALAAHVALGSVSVALFLFAFQFRPEWFADPALVVNGGPASAELFKWAALADLLSYYLPIAVVVIALWVGLRDRGPVIAAASAVAGLGYVLAGGAGAAVLAMAGAPLIAAHAEPGADRAAVATAFGVLVDVVFRAIWQLLDGVLLAVWFSGTGLLARSEQPAFGRLSLALGGLVIIGVALNIVGLGLVRDAGLALVFLLWTGWSIWLAVLIWRRRSPFETLEQALVRLP